MRAIAILLILALGLTSAASSTINLSLYQKHVCANKEDNTKLIVPGSCSEYYVCNKGQAILHECPKSYDPVTGSCVDTVNECCGKSSGYVVSSSNPAKYFKCCNNAVVETAECSNGQEFNLAKLTCDVASNCVGCARTTTPCTTERTTQATPCTTPSCQTTEATTTCSTTTCSTTTCSTTTCSTTTSSTTTCSTTTCSTTTCSTTTCSTTTCSTTTCSTTTCSTTTSSTTTGSAASSSTAERNKITTKRPKKKKQFAADILNQDTACLDQPNGAYVRMPMSCSRYFFCWNQRGLLMNCGDLHFNTRTKACEEASKSDCIDLQRKLLGKHLSKDNF